MSEERKRTGYGNLIDISSRADFKEITRKGGLNCTDKQKIAIRKGKSASAKCRNCKVDCYWKKIMLAKDAHCYCVVPSARIKAIDDGSAILAWDDEVLQGDFSSLMSEYKDMCYKDLATCKELLKEDGLTDKRRNKIKSDMVRMMNTFFMRMKDYKELYEPTVKKEIRVNVDTNWDVMKQRLIDFKELEKSGK